MEAHLAAERQQADARHRHRERDDCMGAYPYLIDDPQDDRHEDDGHADDEARVRRRRRFDAKHHRKTGDEHQRPELRRAGELLLLERSDALIKNRESYEKRAEKPQRQQRIGVRVLLADFRKSVRRAPKRRDRNEAERIFIFLSELHNPSSPAVLYTSRGEICGGRPSLRLRPRR